MLPHRTQRYMNSDIGYGDAAALAVPARRAPSHLPDESLTKAYRERYSCELDSLLTLESRRARCERASM